MSLVRFSAALSISECDLLPKKLRCLMLPRLPPSRSPLVPAVLDCVPWLINLSTNALDAPAYFIKSLVRSDLGTLFPPRCPSLVVICFQISIFAESHTLFKDAL